MDLAWISLAALLVAIVVSCTTEVNVGLLAISFAWLIGAYLTPSDGATIGVKGVIAGFPADLFLTLLGVTCLFALAQSNGTLGHVTSRAVRACRGNLGLVPVMFFVVTLAIAALGAGNIAAVALVAPMAMSVAARAGIPAIVMALMVGHGSIAGAISPFTPMGIIANEAIGRIGFPGHAWQLFFHNFAANATVACGGYFLFGGWRLWRRGPAPTDPTDSPPADSPLTNSAPATLSQLPGEMGGEPCDPFQLRQAATLVVLTMVMVAVVFAQVHIGMAALTGAVALIACRMADEQQTMRSVPWGVIVMVCGMTTLVALAEKTGGLELFTGLLAKFARRDNISGLLALVTGLISVFSSTSGVVLPAFLPTVPGLVEKLGGGNPLSLASAIVVGGNLVDVSPVSTIGALCLASAGPGADRESLFTRLLVWGLAMSLVGATFCHFFLN